MIAIFPELVTAARAADVERLAVLVRRYFGGTDTFRPQPDVERLVRTAGIRIERLPTGGRGALLAKDERGRFAIVAVVEPGLDAAATRFLLAHLLGHFLLDVQPLIAQGDWQVSGYREPQCPLRRYGAGEPPAPAQALDARREARADAFAAALLMPLGMVKKAYERLREPDKLAQFFGVTPAVAWRRLEALGLVPQEGPVNFLDAERRLTPPGRHEGSGEASDVTVEQLTQAATVLAPPSMPRSFAAARYGQTEKKTRVTSVEAQHEDEGPAHEAVSAPGRGTPAAAASASKREGAPAPASARAAVAGRASSSSSPAPARELAPAPARARAAAPASAPAGAEAADSAPRDAPGQPAASKGLARIRELAQKLESERAKRAAER
jgi:hypothetical protein